MTHLSLKTRERVQFIDITAQVRGAVEKSGIQDGACLIYVPHTTAGVTINENADPSVVRDIQMELEKLVPLRDNYAHAEGNSAAHVKSSLVGTSAWVPVSGGALIFGTWQGIYFCEFDGPRNRSLYVQVMGTAGA